MLPRSSAESCGSRRVARRRPVGAALAAPRRRGRRCATRPALVAAVASVVLTRWPSGAPVLSPQWMLAGKPALGASSAPRDAAAAAKAGGAERWAAKPGTGMPETGRPRPEEAPSRARGWREEERELAPGESRLLSRPAGAPPARGGPGWKDQASAAAGFPAPPPPPPSRFLGGPGAPQRGWDAQAAKPEVRSGDAAAVFALQTLLHSAARPCLASPRAPAAPRSPASPRLLPRASRAPGSALFLLLLGPLCEGFSR